MSNITKKRYRNKHFIKGLADALDRIGSTIAALSVMGAWFTDQIGVSAGIVGLAAGGATIALSVYTKVIIDGSD